MAVDYPDGYPSGGAEGQCFFSARVECDEDSCKQGKEPVPVGR
jgi:hypothetical protein